MLFRKIMCKVGLPSLYRSAPFSRGCNHCDVLYVADYFQWRADGVAKWHKVKA